MELKERPWHPDLYFFHGDHLGTATFVTNSKSQELIFGDNSGNRVMLFNFDTKGDKNWGQCQIFKVTQIDRWGDLM